MPQPICQQTYEACDRLATLHFETRDWNVDVCDEHAQLIVAEYGPVFQAYGYQWAPGEPSVNLYSRTSVMRWLAWNGNGNATVSDADCDNEDLPRLTLETARASLIESFYQSTGESIAISY